MKKLSLVLGALLLCMLYLPLLFSTNRAANDFPLAQSDVVSQGFNFPQAWSSRGNGFGENVIFTLWSYPIDFIFGFGSTIGISFTILTKLIFIIPTILLSIFSIRKLLKHVGINGFDQIPGILLFLTNTYVLLLLDGGQLSIALAVSWLPAAYCFFDDSLGSGWQKILRSALSFWLLAMFDIRIAYLLGVVILLQFVYELFTFSGNFLKVFKSYVFSGLAVFFVWMALNAFWIIPFIKVGVGNIPTELTNASQLDFLNFTNLFNGLFLQQPNWPLNSFGQIAVPDWKFVFLLSPVLIVSLKKQLKRKEYFFLVLFLVSVFLVKGANPPLGGIYTNLFNHFPGFFLFRDSTKFFTLIAMSLSVLVSISCIEIGRIFPRYRYSVSFLFGIYVFILMTPVLLNKMTGLFAAPLFKNEYNSVATTLKSDASFGRILWMPSRPPLGYSSLVHPSLDGLTVAGTRPYNIANVGGYERFNFLRESSYSKQLLDILGITYVAYPYYDSRKQDVKPDQIDYYHAFSNQLSQEKWVSQTIHTYPATVIKTQSNAALFSSTSNLWWVVGSDTILEELQKIAGFNVIDNPLVFTDSIVGLLEKYKKTSFGKILTYNKTDVDILGNFLSDNIVLQPNTVIKADFASSYWSVDINNPQKWRELLQSKYRLDAVDLGTRISTSVFENDGTYTLTNNSTHSTILIRALVSPLGGSITFDNENAINTFDSKLGTTTWGISVDPKNPPKEYQNAQFHWFVVRNIPQKSEIKLKTVGTLNAISEIAYVPDTYLNDLLNEIKTLKKNGDIVDLTTLSDVQKKLFFVSNVKKYDVSSRFIAPTQYDLSIHGPSEKKFVLFSQKYDPLWEVGTTQALPVYGLINGFVVDGSELVATYLPQKYFSKPLVILELLLAIGLVFLSIQRIKRHEK